MRKLCKRYSHMVVSGLNHPLYWAFRKWKFGEQIAAEKLKGLTKADLIEKIVGDELAIGSA
jgi:tRNA(His) 5'-end guanylyltransferase